MAVSTISDRFSIPTSSSPCVSGSSSRMDEVASSSFLPSLPWKHTQRQPLHSVAGSSRQPAVKVKAVVCYPATMSWWKKGEKLDNMREITSSDELYNALARAALDNKLVLLDFYSTGCRSCKAMYPKICQLARDNPNVDVLTVNFYENVNLCRSLNVNVLPFFHFYKGSGSLLGAFSCSLSKVDKLRAAVFKYQGDYHTFKTTNATHLSEQNTRLAILPPTAAVGSAV